MGNVIKSICDNCGYTNNFRFGGGRFSYLTHCPVPAINKETQEFENINYYEYKESDKYLFYFNEELKGNSLVNNTIDNFDLKLNTDNNYCPFCKEYSLSFKVIMEVD